MCYWQKIIFVIVRPILECRWAMLQSSSMWGFCKYGARRNPTIHSSLKLLCGRECSRHHQTLSFTHRESTLMLPILTQYHRVHFSLPPFPYL